jgi:hypothetical protein
LALLASMALGGASPALSQSLDSVRTEGGLVPGAQVVRVTSLADSGPGTLRQAIATPGPAVIVFEVGGYIALRTDLEIAKGRKTIAGATAPGGGIVLRGGSLRLRSSDIHLSHFAVYAGSTTDTVKAESRDTISIFGSPSRQNWLHNLILVQMSIGWGVDENIGTQGLVDGIRIERSLLAEALLRGGHPKGTHSMNVFIGAQTRKSVIVGNVLGASDQRNARFAQSTQGVMLNNVVVGYGAQSAQVDLVPDNPNAGSIDFVGNVFIPGDRSRCPMHIVQIRDNLLDRFPAPRIHVSDNIALGNRRQCATPIPSHITAKLSPLRSNPMNSWRVRNPGSLYPGLLRESGARPLARNPIDQRILDSMARGIGNIIDNENSVGGWPDIQPTQRALRLPVAGTQLTTAADVKLMRDYLCKAHFTVGGLGPCPH